MITEMKLIPATEKSYPFITAEFKCKLGSIGYVEDEYFMSGTANVYQEDESKQPRVLFADAPYTTRLLVRRPADMAKFSGNVVIEVLNASAMMDIDRVWVNSWKYFTRNGDIYIGITSKGHVVQALKDFDAQRYEPINWANPMPGRVAPAGLAQGVFGYLPQYESGLFWDMLTDLAKLLRTGSKLNPIAEYGKYYLYLAGWSQSGGYLVRMLKTFASLPENRLGGPLFDGYAASGCGAEMAPINSYEPMSPFFGDPGVPAGKTMGAEVPYININTESENRSCNWIGDYDRPEYKFRTYQIPGSSHDSKYNLITYYNGQGYEDCKRIGKALVYEGTDGEPMDLPYGYVFNAAMRNLYAWVRQGVPAPHAEKIQTAVVDEKDADAFGAALRNCTDAFGNAKGGIRTPALDYPVGTYSNWSVSSDGRVNPMFGKVVPFSAEKLQLLYGSLENYEKLVEVSAEEAIALGFLLREDKAGCVADTVELARQRGLC